MDKIKRNQRISASVKNANKKQWYKDEINLLDKEHYSDELYDTYTSGISDKKRMKVNYDLFNNILNLDDFSYVCQPFGAEVGELPANMVNRDISSGKIKAVLGMEMKNPFSWKIMATNAEASTRKEETEFGKIREYVVNTIMLPIRQRVEMKYQEQLQGQLSEDQRAQIMQQIEQETMSMAPQKVKEYMQRDHQDPAEVMSHQLMEYLIQKTDAKRKFNKIFKHATLSAKGLGYVGILNGEPEFWNVNSLRFNHDRSPDLEFVEDGEWATCEYPMTPSQIVRYFGKELSNKDIDRIYEAWGGNRSSGDDNEIDFFAIDERLHDYDNNSNIKVLHCTWKSLRKIGFLTYRGKTGKKAMMMVDEKYKFDKDAGDIKLEWEWIPEVYEGWKIKIGEPIYVQMRPIPGQFKDLEDLYYCKLPYYGAIYDNMNSEPTALMDRLKVYQYYYNILWYRFELLAASDKGKKVLMNINQIPDSAGIDIKKWQYFLESTPYMWYDPNEEGNGGGYADVNTVAKVIDLSYAGDMNKYIEMMEYVRQQAGRSVGVTDQVEGMIGAREGAKNVQQGLIQTSNILEPYFELHSHTKRNILQALLEMAKVAYAGEKAKKLSFVLDDMSIKTLEVDMGLINNSRLGLFVSNSAKAQETKDLIRGLAQAAMQNQKVELSDVISVVRQEGIVEAEETLKVAEQQRRDFEQGLEERKIQAQKEKDAADRKEAELQHEREKEITVLKERERRKTVVAQAAITGASFNPDQDADNDGKNDFLEILNDGLDADIKRNKQSLEREKFDHQRQVDNRKLDQTDKKLALESKKANTKK